MSEISPENYKEAKVLLNPTQVIENFNYNGDSGIYTPPFATKDEFWGLLSGSEHCALVSDGKESLLSLDFVQCSGALLRNRRTNEFTIVHQSLWSSAAEAAIMVQRADDLDLIILDPRMNGSEMYSYIEKAHNKNTSQVKSFLESTGGKNFWAEDRILRFGEEFNTRGSIYGLDNERLKSYVQRATNLELAPGKINYIGTVELPNERKDIGRSSVLYRPEEDVIYVLSSSTKQLYKYSGFGKKVEDPISSVE